MKFLIIIFFVTLLLACNQGEKAVPIKERFDAIESIVGTTNWQLVDGQDTSYVYFSRIGDAQFNVYHFRIEKGDSVNTTMNNIRNFGDTIKWNWHNDKLMLTDVTNNIINWENTSNEKEKYVLKKMDSLHLSILFPDKHESVMRMTLPLATFLVRSHYDYIHNTHTVDSAIVPPRQLIKK